MRLPSCRSTGPVILLSQLTHLTAPKKQIILQSQIDKRSVAFSVTLCAKSLTQYAVGLFTQVAAAELVNSRIDNSYVHIHYHVYMQNFRQKSQLRTIDADESKTTCRDRST